MCSKWGVTMAKRQGFHGLTALVLFGFFALICYAVAASIALFPAADGLVTHKDSGLTVDASHSDQGYIMVKHAATDKHLKMRITQGNDYYTYDLPSGTDFQPFGLPFGSGKYKIQVFKQVSGKRYSNAASISFSASLADETLPYLYPNQYVSYGEQSQAVALAETLCKGASTAQDKLAIIQDYVVRNIQYDYILAISVQSGYLPDVDHVLATGKGICFDYAALLACMLRAVGVPAKLEIGYADKLYHAWNSVLINDEWLHIDTTAEANNMQVRKYTTERTY